MALLGKPIRRGKNKKFEKIYLLQNESPYRTKTCAATTMAKPIRLALITEAPFAPGMLGIEEGPTGTPLQLPEGAALPGPLLG